jgi:hypothetical protein
MTEQQRKTGKWRKHPASDPQYRLIRSIAAERSLSDECRARLDRRLEARDMNKGEASNAITYLKRQPKASDLPATLTGDERPSQVPQQMDTITVDKGMFRRDGEVYVVVKAKHSDRLYAKRLVELRDAQGDRLTDAGGHVRFEFDYDRGAIYKLDESMRLSQEEGRELAVRYGKCAMCGRKLKVAESVERGYGPVCWSRFTPSSSEVTA